MDATADKDKALKVLCYDRANRAHLESTDPMALMQSLKALGVKRDTAETLADHLSVSEPLILKNLMAAAERLDWDEDLTREMRSMEPKQAEKMLKAAWTLQKSGLSSPEAREQMWDAVVVELGFWVTGGGAA